MYYVHVSCHGCGGKGWVEVGGTKAVICPVCDGSGLPYGPSLPTPYQPMREQMWVDNWWEWQPTYMPPGGTGDGKRYIYTAGHTA